jgi:hypothetical protein
VFIDIWDFILGVKDRGKYCEEKIGCEREEEGRERVKDRDRQAGSWRTQKQINNNPVPEIDL